MQFIDDVNDSYWQGKRVLLRVGFDMGKEFAAMEEFRIKKGFASITYLLQRGANVLLLNHNGRPAGKIDPALSNAMVAKKVSKLLQREVPLIPLETKEVTSTPLALLENLRFDPREEAYDSSFALELAQLGDAYVNDAFSNSHRAHTSMTSLASLLPHFGGLQLRQELEVLGEVLNNPVHPLLLIIGGLKIETKMKMVKRFWDRVEGILLGGALANTFLHAKGIAVGKSIIEPSYLGDIKDIPLTDTRLHLPLDVRVARDFDGKEGVRITGTGNLKEDEIILDIGPDTELLFDNVIKSAKMVIWNGPLGKFEISVFAHGTKSVLRSLLESSAQVIIGGGETVELLEMEGAIDKVYFVSTGGGAMLSFLAGEKMPGLEVLNDGN